MQTATTLTGDSLPVSPVYYSTLSSQDLVETWWLLSPLSSVSGCVQHFFSLSLWSNLIHGLVPSQTACIDAWDPWWDVLERWSRLPHSLRSHAQQLNSHVHHHILQKIQKRGIDYLCHPSFKYYNLKSGRFQSKSLNRISLRSSRRRMAPY